MAHNYILKQKGIAHIYLSRTASRVYNYFSRNSIARIYFSRTTSRVDLYISAEQHRPALIYTPAEQHRMFAYAPWEWRPLGVAARHLPKSLKLLAITNAMKYSDHYRKLIELKRRWKLNAEDRIIHGRYVKSKRLFEDVRITGCSSKSLTCSTLFKPIWFDATLVNKLVPWA